MMKKLIDTPTLAEYLSVTPQTIYNWRNEGMPKIKVGRTYRYELEEVLQWLNDRDTKKEER